MKKIIVAVVAVCSLAMAGNYTKEDRIKDMNQMAEAMNTIQSGFFYNNYETVAQGVTKLTDTVVHVKPPLEEKEEKNPMARYMNQKIQMSNKIVKKINQKGLTILQRFKDGDTEQAVQAYTKIMRQCMKCHREIRHW
ncbi:cytochrome C [Sulfurimonas paralvinellae]|uniref:Cytochrome C n=1 Tax=Sulfurimonas paralvinellae TaxID=317658 RepID=A0A7M1B8G5_9BACT|nr:cytochrome C [Sulfurimonas paralvinellae]QOP45736.1 cytochrome C [Sulfurimonas paralvinellae]